MELTDLRNATNNLHAFLNKIKDTYMNWKSINPSEAFTTVLYFSMVAALAWLVSYIPLFILIFLFGTWDIAVKYTAIVAVIVSSIFSLAFVIHENKNKKILKCSLRRGRTSH